MLSFQFVKHRTIEKKEEEEENIMVQFSSYLCKFDENPVAIVTIKVQWIFFGSEERQKQTLNNRE